MRQYFKYKKSLLAIIFIVIYIILLNALIYFEGASSDATILTFFDSVWYSIVTLTTVGYGDKTPNSIAGKIIGLLFVMGSITVLSVLIGKATDSISEMRERKKMGYKGTKFENHVVIVGLDPFIKHIIPTLLDAHQKVAVITDHKAEIDLMYERYGKENFFALYSALDDYKSFSKANIEKAKIVHPALKTDTEELVLILNLKDHYPNLKFIVVLEESNLRNTFASAGVTYVLSKNEFAAKFMASYIFEPAVADLTTDLITPNISVDSDHEFDIQQFLVTEGNLLAGKKWGEFSEIIRNNYRSIPIGIKKHSGELHKIPDKDLIVEVNDYVIFINNETSSRKISEDYFHVDQGERGE